MSRRHDFIFFIKMKIMIYTNSSAPILIFSFLVIDCRLFSTGANRVIDDLTRDSNCMSMCQPDVWMLEYTGFLTHAWFLLLSLHTWVRLFKGMCVSVCTYSRGILNHQGQMQKVKPSDVCFIVTDCGNIATATQKELSLLLLSSHASKWNQKCFPILKYPCYT